MQVKWLHLKLLLAAVIYSPLSCCCGFKHLCVNLFVVIRKRNKGGAVNEMDYRLSCHNTLCVGVIHAHSRGRILSGVTEAETDIHREKSESHHCELIKHMSSFMCLAHPD